jgi:hypothetical protein
MSARLAGSAIFAKLTSSAGTALWGTRVFDRQASESVIAAGTVVYTVYSYVAGGQLNVQTTDMEDLRFDVRCIAPTPQQSKQGADYIASAFHKQTLTVNGWTNWATTVIGEISQVENDEGKQSWIDGKQVRIRLSSTT